MLARSRALWYTCLSVELWRKFVEGTCTRGEGLTVAFGAAAGALILVLAVFRPLVRLLLSRDDERHREANIRRRLNVLLLAVLALGFWVHFHAMLPPAVRHERLRYQVSELAVIALGGYAIVDLTLLCFGTWLPQVRGRVPMAPILRDLIRVLLALGLFLAGVSQAFPNADIGALITTSAILSIVLGLALQESLSNVFGGIMLTIDRPFKPGDWIEIDGQEGKVLDSNWRSTRVLTREDDVIYVPNSTLAKSNVVNFSAPDPDKMVKRTIGIEYGAPPNKVRALLSNMMRSVEGVLPNPAPDVFVKDYGDSAILYEMRFWILDYDRREWIESEVMRNVWYHLKREGISIPFPIRDVTLRRERPERKPEEVLALLRKVEIFKPLKEEELALLAGDLGLQMFGRDEKICRQGEQGTTFYIVKSGTVRVTAQGDGGVEAEVARLGPGSCFGEMALLTGEPRASTCTALEDCELLVLGRESFEVLLRENAAVMKSMSEILAARQSATQEKLTQERETAVRRRAPEEQQSGAQRILEKIRTMFRFKR